MLSSSASAAIELDMDLTAAMRRRKSLAVLQKIDPKVLEIVFDCPHVAIYRFTVCEQAKRWERLGVEGALFITGNASDDHPAHSLIVLNRRGPLDFILNISTVMKISLQAPYLMLLCSSGEERSVDSSCIFGIWVHDASELQSIKSIIDRTSTSARKSSSATKADRLLSLLRPPCQTSLTRLPVATDFQSDYPKATPNQTTAPERLEADHNSGESARSRDIIAAAPHLTISSSSSPPNLHSPSSSTVLAKSKRLLSILKKAPPPGLDGERDHHSKLSRDTTTTTHESIAVQKEECSGVDNNNNSSSSSSSSCRRAQLFSLMGLQQPAPPPLLLSSQSSDVSTLQRSDQDREKLLRLLRPATDQLPASELLTDSQIARKRTNVTTTTAAARHVVDEKRDKLQSLQLGKGKTSNNHADIIQHPDQSAAVAVSSTSTCRTVKLISPSDLKAYGCR